MFVISIDVGIFNLGLIFADTKHFTIQKIYLCKLVNIKSLCEFCNDNKCELYHELCISDYMSHLFKQYNDYFQKANLIIIERQPPTGFISIQELILTKYRHKTKVISPNAMHKYFNITHYNYDQRKQFTIKYSDRYINHFEDYIINERKHDLADAVCLLIYYLKHIKHIKSNKKKINTIKQIKQTEQEQKQNRIVIKSKYFL